MSGTIVFSVRWLLVPLLAWFTYFAISLRVVTKLEAQIKKLSRENDRLKTALCAADA